MQVSLDFETRSAVDLKTRGAFVYFECPHARVMFGSYRIDGGSVRRWLYPDRCPDDLAAAITAGAVISAHNCQFETLCFDWLVAHCGWPAPRPEQFRCTAATAAALALPRSLGDLGEALALDIQKDKEGKRLIKKFSVPRRPTADEDPAAVYWNETADHPEDWELFRAYCDQDVLAEDAADDRMVSLPASEQEMWWIDQRINRRGIRIDVASAQAAISLAERSKAQLDAEMHQATDGAVRRCSEPGKLLAWVQEQGVELDSAAKADIGDLLALETVPPHVRRALELRQEAAKTSVSKLQAMLNRASADGRVRGSFLFDGASTGRWASMGVNFANLPRPRKEYETAHLNRAALFRAFRRADPALVQMLYGPALGRPLHLISDAIRSFVWAAPGHDLLQADYTGIEGNVIAWSSGETWKVRALFEIMRDPSLPDMYRRTAASIMNTTTDEIHKKHPLRQSVGKVSELALGFGGGVSAFYSMSRNYGVKLDPLFAPVWATADEERRQKAIRRYKSNLAQGKGRTDVLSRDAWIACELIKVGWRASNPEIAKGWRLREEAARNAIQSPGERFRVLKFNYLVTHGFLWCQLPSSRCLAYAAPRLRDQVWAEVRLPDGTWAEAEVMDREEAERRALKGDVRINGATSPSISALGVGPGGKRLQRFHLYGGLLAENDTQAIAADCLRVGMRNAEAAGYPIIAHVYDEIITEVPRDFGDVGAFERLICQMPIWAEGLPLSASGWRGKRYRKD